MRTILATDDSVLFLGKQGENLATRILFPYAEKWKEIYGEGVFQLIFLRPEDTTPYACVIGIDEENVTWDITNTELANPGTGRVELCYFVGSTLAISLQWITKSIASLTDVGDTPPEPWESWVEEVLQAGSDAEQASADAIQAKNDAEIARDEAAQAKIDAETAEDHAEDFAGQAEKWAVGEINGEPVPETDPTYNNNAKAYAEQAAASVAEGQYFGFYIDENGNLYVVKTPESENLDFRINYDTGELEVVFL